MDIQKLRVAALRRLIGTDTLKDFAERNDLDSSYLSQILNGHRNLGEKAARNMEEKIGCKPGALVSPQVTEPTEDTGVLETGVEQAKTATGTNMAALQRLKGKVTPRSLAALNRIEKAATEGRLKEADLVLLEGIAARFEELNTEQP